MKHWEKLLRRASADDRRRILDALITLKEYKFPPNTIKLKGFEKYRTRVGNWRIIFHYQNNRLVLEDIERRDGHNY